MASLSPLRNRLIRNAGSPLSSPVRSGRQLFSGGGWVVEQKRSLREPPQPDAPDAARAATAAIPTAVAAQWHEQLNRLQTPEVTSPKSSRLIYWKCAECSTVFKKRVRDHCDEEGRCPACAMKPRALKGKRAPATPTGLLPPSGVPRGRSLDPMLACRWDDQGSALPAACDLFASPKMDGVRCVVCYDQSTRRPIFLSRLGNAFQSCDFIAEELMAAFERDPELVFDAEIYHHGLSGDFSTLVGAVKVMKDNRTAAHLAIQKKLQLHCFDLLYARSMVGGSTKFSLRLAQLERILSRLPNKFTQLVDHQLVRRRDVEKVHDRFVQSGYEGVILRPGDRVYEYGKRTTALLKFKKMMDDEFKIVGVEEGRGRLQGRVGAVACMTRDKQVFRANFALPDDQRQFYWQNKHLLTNKMATVQYQELSNTGIPRFAVFKAIRSSANKKDFV